MNNGFFYLYSQAKRILLMLFILTIILLLFGSRLPLAVHARNGGASKWMERLNDKQSVASLSLPGAHDAATGEGLCFSSAFGVTQTLTVGEQWASGVRAFDLRPAVRDTVLHIYHGPIRTKISFSAALDTILSKLEEHPTEFAIVLLREESDSENEKEHTLWSQEVGRIINNLGNKAAIFSPEMTVADARGKILFLTRNAYSGCNKGATIKGWSHSKDGTANAQIVSCTDGTAARLQMQDFFAPTDEEKRNEKERAVTKLLSLAADAPADVWSINFVSGYSSTLFGCTSIATTQGYKENAARMHPKIIEYLSANSKKESHLGIIFMDFAGVDKLPGNMWHWRGHDVHGDTLLKAIIESNF